MGKVKTRHIYHSSAPRSTDETITFEPNISGSGASKNFLSAAVEKETFVPSNNIFSNVFIPPEALKQRLPPFAKANEKVFELKSTMKKMSEMKDTEVYKMKKRQRRKVSFAEVIRSAEKFQKKLKREKKKKAAAILGDFKPLQDALPTLEELIEKNKIKNYEGRPRSCKPLKLREKEMMEDIQTFKQVLNDSAYNTDPLGVIRAQLEERLRNGCL